MSRWYQHLTTLFLILFHSDCCELILSVFPGRHPSSESLLTFTILQVAFLTRFPDRIPILDLASASSRLDCFIFYFYYFLFYSSHMFLIHSDCSKPILSVFPGRHPSSDLLTFAALQWLYLTSLYITSLQPN